MQGTPGPSDSVPPQPAGRGRAWRAAMLGALVVAVVAAIAGVVALRGPSGPGAPADAAPTASTGLSPGIATGAAPGATPASTIGATQGLGTGAAASTARRFALVIGNGQKYAELPLPNPERDARLVAETLASLGFEVQFRQNVTSNEFRIALAEFLRRANDGQTDALLYFAGHGVRVGDRNYLLPVDVDMRSADETQALSIDLSAVLAEVRPEPSRARIFIIDACRDNPFAAQPDGKRGAKGLMQTDSSGSKLAFSAGPGQAAEDGPPGGHSVYARALVQQMKQPGVELDVVLRRVREQVHRETQSRQQPWDGGNPLAQFFFNPRTAAVAGGPPGAASPAGATATVRLLMQADAQLNTDAQGQPASLALRIYQLRDADAMRRASFDSLYDNEVHTLGSSLVRSPDRLFLQPGQNREIQVPLDAETRTLAVMGAFRELERARWRQVLAVPPGVSSATLRLQAGARGLDMAWVP